MCYETSVPVKLVNYCNFSEFCNHKNDKLDITPDEIPSGESFDFMLVPPREETNDGAEEDANENTPETKGMVVYCIDISRSMGSVVRLPEIQCKRLSLLNLFG